MFQPGFHLKHPKALKHWAVPAFRCREKLPSYIRVPVSTLPLPLPPHTLWDQAHLRSLLVLSSTCPPSLSSPHVSCDTQLHLPEKQLYSGSSLPKFWGHRMESNVVALGVCASCAAEVRPLTPSCCDSLNDGPLCCTRNFSLKQMTRMNSFFIFHFCLFA